MRQMCEARRQLRVIYMSGYSDAAGAAASSEGGPVVLAKLPFSRSALLQSGASGAAIKDSAKLKV